MILYRPRRFVLCLIFLFCARAFMMSGKNLRQILSLQSDFVVVVVCCARAQLLSILQLVLPLLHTNTHSPTYTHTHTLIYITTTNNKSVCVCSSDDRRLNKIKFDNQHYAPQLFLFGLHHIALTTLVPQVRSACQQESGCSESATPPPISDLIGSTSTW